MARSERSIEKEQYWRLVVGEQRLSGLNIRMFCRQRALSEPSFYAWRKELQKRDAARAVGTVGTVGNGNGLLIPVSVVDENGENSVRIDAAANRRDANVPLEIVAPSGFTLRFDHDTTSETISRLLDVIAHRPITHRPLARRPSEGEASC